MRLPRRALDAYNAAVKQCGDGAERASLRALSVWLEANPDAEISEVREFCKTLLHTVGTSYGQDAGDAAYALRSLVADGLDIELPDVDYAYEPDPEYVDKTARYQVEKLKAGDSDGFGKAISDAARYFAERGANDTMTNLGEHDAKKLGKRVLFARVPTGATTCPYCLMLASRGFVYSSELKALNANHRNCDCRIVEGFPGMTVEGYDPDAYYDMWKHPEKYENARLDSSTVQIVGVSKGEPMNFDDADGMKANPGYESDFARVMNCQTCVVANEARRRGYEVQAQPYSKQNEAMFALAERPTRAYINPETGKEPEMIRVEESPTKARFNKLCEETVKDGERYHLRIETKAGGGHVVCMDRDENGVLRVYDPQDGSIYKASEYLKRAKYSSRSYGITVPEDNYIFRVDNAEFNIELINGALEPAQ